MLKMIKKCISGVIRFCYKHTCHHISVKENYVLFLSFHGRGYSDNPKYMHLYMKDEPKFKDFKFIWACKNTNTKIDNAKVVRYNGILYFYYLARCKYWVVNCKLPKHIIKKEDQVYLQTWHGTPLKKLAHDIEVKEGTTFYRTKMSKEEMYETYDIDVAKYNYMISPNPFSTKVFQSAFRINRERLIETGYPRNDILVNYTKEQMKDIKKRFGLPEDKKVILYAPTWRDNSYVTSGYTFELEANFDKWKEVLGKDYVVLFKPHYLIINKYENRDDLKDFLYLVDAKADINDCYLVSDILVTDYSSVFFDYAILNRPMYFYMYDLETYASDLRGFYFDINEVLPGPIVKDEDTLLENISKNIDLKEKEQLSEKNSVSLKKA